MPNGGFMTLVVTSSGAGNWTITKTGAAFKVSNGGAGTIGMGPAASIDIISLTNDNVNVYATVGYNFT
jgi:hypothetical protein